MNHSTILKCAVLGGSLLLLGACGDDTTSDTSQSVPIADATDNGAEADAAPAGPPPTAEPGEPVDFAGYESFKRYLVKSGVIEYRLDGMRAGTETLYWDDWGVKEARYTKVTVNLIGVSQDVEEWLISTPDVIYTIDMTSNTAVKTKNPGVGFFKGLSEDEMAQMSKQLLEATGAKLLGTDFVAEQTCELWDVPLSGGQECIWKGIALSESGSLGGLQSDRVATTVVAGIEVDDKHFTLPKDVQITDNTIDPNVTTE